MISHSELADIPQGSDAWLAWKRPRIGASEVAAIMGESEYETAHSLWRLKTGRKPPKDTNVAMQFGMENEAKVRALYEIQTGIDCPPALFQHPTLDWAICSLDGRNDERKLILECKCMGMAKHAMVRAGIVPPTYKAQLQWQMFVTGDPVVHFVSLDPEDHNVIEILPVTKDLAYWDKMIAKATEFWGFLQSDTPPPLTNDDYLVIDELYARSVFQSWRDSKLYLMQVEELGDPALLKASKKRLEEAKAQVKEFMSRHPKIKCAGVRAHMAGGKNLTVSLDERTS